ncbi:MAG: 30S ribosomal protein S6 [Holosporaceae bacterium]|jgi:small subunit ribosomal protein S6|nr:30S ribosomal protein S6 [Holosporaceae bacterium]
MNLYENVFIGRQDLSQQQMEALGVGLGLFVTQNAGEVVRSEYCGFRNLAYPIKKNQKGHYYVMQLRAPPTLIAEFERVMRLNEDIIRHLLVKVDAFDDRGNLIPQARVSGDDFALNAKRKSYKSADMEDEAFAGAMNVDVEMAVSPAKESTGDAAVDELVDA